MKLNKFKIFRKNNLKFKIWGYLILLCIVILAFLWFSQVVSLKYYYEFATKRDISKIVEKLKEEDTSEEEMNDISHNYGACIEIYSQKRLTFSSSECKTMIPANLKRYKENFISSNKSEQGYEISNSKYNTKSFLYGLVLNSKYVFITVSLEPVESTVNILKGQLFLVSLVALAVSLLLAYDISRRISKPIEKINSSAKLLAEGKYDTYFEKDYTINELDELADTLNKTSSELGKTEQLRREFMANVSHDLKTPLTMIRAYAEMVRDLSYKNKEKREEHLNVIIQESERLNILVNDILELSKIQTGAYKLEKEIFDLDAFIRKILKQYEIYTIQDGYQIKFYGGKDFYVCADKKRMEQVFYNLINNALNYTGEDKQVVVALFEENGRIRVEISDTGKGIPEDEIDAIWEKYYKIDKSYSRKSIGSGVGLSIVKSIFLNHNIEYGVKSKINKGTTFYFYMKKENEVK